MPDRPNPSMVPKIVIVGATGVFGRRFAGHLARTPGLELVLTSRSLDRAQELLTQIATSPETKAALTPVAFELSADFGATLKQLKPTVVVDCSGPFQAADFRLPLASAEAGAHFVDLAEARGYILNFAAALDAAFRARGLVALGGASSSPALSASIIAEITRGWRRVDHIDVAIVPGGKSEVGEAAIAGALSYCGAPVPVVFGGKLEHAIGWSGTAQVKLGRDLFRSVAPVETAEAELLALRYPEATTIRFGAGLDAAVEHRGMAVIARLRRMGLLNRPERLASILRFCRKFTRLSASETGGMIVCVVGVDADGQWAQAGWHLLARDNHGLHVPPSPAIAAVRSILRGEVAPGARPALDLPLAAIEAEFTPYAITTECSRLRAERNLLSQAVGHEAYQTLPQAVRDFHDLSSAPVWKGRANTIIGRSPLARLLGWIIGFPGTGQQVEVTVVTERKQSNDGLVPVETWTRQFGKHRFVSELSIEGAHRAQERFGWLTFDLDLAVTGDRLAYPVGGWRLGFLRLPKALAPRSEASEWQDHAGRFNFDVRLSLPIFGLLAHYQGWLVPEKAA